MASDIPALDLPPVEEFRHRARRWLAANMEPVVGDRSRPRERGSKGDESDLPAERALQRRLYEGGFAGITWPAEYGGAGLTPEHEGAFREEAAGYRLPRLGIAGATTMLVCGPTILAHASAEFKAHHVPRMLAGDELWVQFFSEPDAGSDLAAVVTRADRRDGGWVLNGAKVWTSGALDADFGMCLARTDWDAPKHAGLTWFAVPTRVTGVEIRPIREINGSQEFCGESLTDVALTDDHVLGPVNGGWRVAQTMLIFERSAGAATQARRVRPGTMASDLLDVARRNGRAADPGVRRLLAQVHVNDSVQDALDDLLAARAAQGPLTIGEAAYGKLAAGIFDPRRAVMALAVAAASGIAWRPDTPEGDRTALAYLNARVMAIAGGTNEMQRNAIAERVLGLPKDVPADRDVPFRLARARARGAVGRPGGAGA
jgi:alkylation response protein AidB-like acyl-CoA dehydrogenase